MPEIVGLAVNVPIKVKIRGSEQAEVLIRQDFRTKYPTAGEPALYWSFSPAHEASVGDQQIMLPSTWILYAEGEIPDV